MITDLNFLHVLLLVLAVVWLALVVWAIVRTVRDRALDRPMKVVWVVVLILFPVVGLLLWVIVLAVKASRGRQDSRSV